MQLPLLAITILFWLTCAPVIIYDLVFDVVFWQKSNYQAVLLWHVLRWDYQLSHRHKLVSAAKVLLFLGVACFAIWPTSVVPAAAVVLCFGLWFSELLSLMQRLILHRLKLLVLDFRMLTICLIGSALLLATIISTSALLRDVYLFLIISTLLSLFLDLTSPLWASILVLITWPIQLIADWWVVNRARNILAQNPNLLVIAIAGSFAKSTTKWMLQHVLRADFNLAVSRYEHSSAANVARTVLKSVNSQTQILVLEINSYQSGHIRRLGTLISPQISALLGVEQSHIGLFGSVENTLAAQTELLQITKPAGMVILNGEDSLLRKLELPAGLQKLWLYPHGQAHQHTDQAAETVSLKELKQTSKGIRYQVSTSSGSTEFTVPLELQNFELSLTTTIATAHSAGMELGKIADLIQTLPAPIYSGTELMGDFGTRLIVDHQNQNLTSFTRSLQHFVSQPGHKILVTDGLKHLKQYKQQRYRELSKLLGSQVSVVISSDPDLLSALRHNNTNTSLQKVGSDSQMLYQIRAHLQPGCSVLFLGDIEPFIIRELKS